LQGAEASKQGAGESIHYHGPHKWWIIAGGPQKMIDLIKKFNLFDAML